MPSHRSARCSATRSRRLQLGLRYRRVRIRRCDFRTYAHRYSYRDQYTHTRSSRAYRHSNGKRDRNCNGKRDRNSNGKRDRNSNADTDAHSDCNGDRHCDADRDTHAGPIDDRQQIEFRVYEGRHEIIKDSDRDQLRRDNDYNLWNVNCG
jgi:hypothetical protein